ncbi:SGNH/GDSL hydrolase family protein [Loigolactobacillus zhaoyuanensis]|uniref:SGNH/GDSL hydrolase family protein n=1 Tax=Loigolactobacillus zhaoyuanensis TaxID=2486017 RepID=UPI000F73D081|nr:SGNH/GDSL hydrolase family protein [Loigolactobacillus zhaoyuanensis]
MQIQHYCALGDSITDRRNQLVSKWYQDWLVEWWQPAKTSLLAVSGSTVCAEFDSMAARSRMIPDDCDLLTIYGGINDFGRSQPLGRFGDTLNTTFYGALDQLLRSISREHPQTAVYFISHVRIGTDFFPATNQFGLQQADYEQAIAQVTAAYAVPHLSLYHSWLNFATPSLAERYSLDTLHPNDAGQLAIAHLIDDFVKIH